MIIGEGDQCLSENNYYESPQKFEVLKRKFSNENENSGEIVNFGDQSVSGSFEYKSDDKMQFIDNVISEHYQTYEATEIHQDGEQSYINLTVLTPTLVQYDKSQSDQHQEMTNFHNSVREEQKPSSTTISTNAKYESRNYHQNQAGNEEDVKIDQRQTA
jgi:hypothetical protein